MSNSAELYKGLTDPHRAERYFATLPGEIVKPRPDKHIKDEKDGHPDGHNRKMSPYNGPTAPEQEAQGEQTIVPDTVYNLYESDGPKIYSTSDVIGFTDPFSGMSPEELQQWRSESNGHRPVSGLPTDLDLSVDEDSLVGEDLEPILDAFRSNRPVEEVIEMTNVPPGFRVVGKGHFNYWEGQKE